MSQPFPFSLSSRESLLKEQLEKLVTQMYHVGLRYSEAVREFQKAFILTVLREEKLNQIRTAQRLGMHRNTLRRTIQELGVEIAPLRAARRRPPVGERQIRSANKPRAI